MQNNIFNIDGQFGNKENDIQCVYILAQKENVFSKIYIKYNNGNIKRIVKPSNQDNKDFAKRIRNFLVDIGASNKNKGNRWFVLTKNNNLGVNFDYLDNTYINEQLSDDNISFKTEDTFQPTPRKYKIHKVDKFEELEELSDDYAQYKARMIMNLLASAAFAFAIFSPIEGPWSYIDLKNNLSYTIDALLAAAAVIDGIMMYVNKKFTKKIEASL